MRKYSSTFWWLILFGLVSSWWSYTGYIENLATVSAIGIVIAFIFFYVALMLPDDEKYND